MFGTDSIIPTIELPSNLYKLSKIIGNEEFYDEESLINKHTNLPFYMPFLNKKNQETIKELMINSDGKGIYAKIGLIAGGICCILFLCDSAESFFTKITKVDYPFGKPPWPCLNPAANHYRKLVIHKCNITSDYKTRRSVGTFECNCGFVYSRKQRDTESDIYIIGRIKKFGEVWEKKLVQLICDRQYCIREISRLLNCDPKTVIKYGRKLGVGDIINSSLKIEETILNHVSINYRERYSDDILQLSRQHPEYSRTRIRKELSKQYSWFYRNDKKWLENNLPMTKLEYRDIARDNLRIDWNERDNETCENIKNIYEGLVNSEKPIRITKSIIGQKLGISALLEHHLKKLVKTQMYLTEITETVEEFQIRRVELICTSMMKRNMELKEWKILKAAGLKSNCSTHIKEKISTYMKKQYIYSTI